MTDVAINTPSCNTFHPNTSDIPPLPKIKIRQILEHVSKHYGHGEGVLIGPGKAHPHALHRWVVMYLARVISNPSSSQIARVLRRDHTTVLNGLEQIQKRMAVDSAFAAEVRRLEADIRQGLKS